MSETEISKEIEAWAEDGSSPLQDALTIASRAKELGFTGLFVRSCIVLAETVIRLQQENLRLLGAVKYYEDEAEQDHKRRHSDTVHTTNCT